MFRPKDALYMLRGTLLGPFFNRPSTMTNHNLALRYSVFKRIQHDLHAQRQFAVWAFFEGTGGGGRADTLVRRRS